MARVHGVAGEWARVKGSVAGLWPLFLAVFAAGFALALTIVSLLWGMVALVAAGISAILGLRSGFRHVERYFKGARGEEKVANILSELPEPYHVFNDFKVGSRHVDHVVAGPGGVFAVETKFWSGKVTIEEGHVLVDGRLPSRSPVVQASREAALVRSALASLGWSGMVTPVVAFASDTFAAHRAMVGGTIIINSSELRSSFASDRVVIPPQELDRLVTLMENMV